MNNFKSGTTLSLVAKCALLLIIFHAAFSHQLSAQEQGYTAPSHGVRTYYQTFGTGHPILIINGGPGMNSNGFAQIAKKLSAHNQTIIYDQRGTGKSTLPVLDTATITMELMVQDMEALRKHLNIETWTVMGHSFGGILASYYATLHPARIDKLILSSSGGLNLDFLSYVGQSINARLSKQERDSLALWNENITHGDTSFYARLQRGKALAPAYLYNKKYVPIIAERLTQGNATINSLVFANLSTIRYDCTEKLKNFQPKVLIIQGKQDIIHEKTARLAQSVFPNARLALLDSCGHYGWLDKEAEYMMAVEKFLQEKP